jgi:SAM-dependent methyltransferase
MTIEEALRQAAALARACRSDPGLWNVIQAEHEWALHGDACDPLSPAAPERALKALQRDIYLEVWGDALAAIPSEARVMVAGGGTGRFARELVRRGWRVELVDASPEAVRRARHHLGDAVPATVGDISHPDTLPGQTYDLVLAVEVVCYATDPSLVMQRLSAALRVGGMLLFSVEARPGALLADRDLSSPQAARAVLNDGVVTLQGLKHVHYYTRDEAGDLAEKAGLSLRAVEGVCYVPDGPLSALVDAARLEEPSHAEQIRDLERRCRRDPVLRELPRAWAVAATAP